MRRGGGGRALVVRVGLDGAELLVILDPDMGEGLVMGARVGWGRLTRFNFTHTPSIP